MSSEPLAFPLPPLDSVRVVILAGGKGTRLKPYTTVFPKPLMPIGDMPILEVVLRRLRACGFRKITISVNHLADLIRTFFRDGAALGLDITYCMEDQPLGTAGSLALVDDLTDPFMVLNGDLLTTFDFESAIRHHIGGGAMATIGVFPREVPIDFGVLETGPDRSLVRYVEKPVYRYEVSMGINIFKRDVLRYIPNGRPLNIPDLMMALKHDGQKVMTFLDDCEWLDIGRPDDYEAASVLFEQNREKYLGR